MPISYNEVRQFALALPGVSERRAYRGPSLHVGRKFLGRLREDGETFVLKIDPTDRTQLLEISPDAFFLTEHYRPYPYVLVNLLAVKPATLKPLIERAWRMIVSKKAILAYDASARSSRA
ncbi:MAG TPA: MmcQ/YjbR family DNA-binding protein [Candidatus Udaeobacter sp.]|nr:MmcQ/YjbR family DNA-binding protein [Candidatus Udaeobacter sp.]